MTDAEREQIAAEMICAALERLKGQEAMNGLTNLAELIGKALAEARRLAASNTELHGE